MLDLFEKLDEHNIKENFDKTIFHGNINEDLNQNMTFNGTNERYFSQNSFLKQKRKNSNKKVNRKHTKYSYDNIKRQCKHLVIENVMKFINNKIYEVYDGKIDNGLLKKKLFKLNQSQKTNADVEFNKKFIYRTLKDILSQNITKQISMYEQEHNKKVIEKIITEKKENFEKLFNLTFIQCVEHFIGKKYVKELNGLTLFTELKEEIVNKYENDGESYFENLRLFLIDFENKIIKAKSRKKRLNIGLSIDK